MSAQSAVRLLIGGAFLACMLGCSSPVALNAPDLPGENDRTAGAVPELAITSTNLSRLTGFPASAWAVPATGSVNSKLKYASAVTLSVAFLPQAAGGYAKFFDNKGNLPGECVSAVKALAWSNATTSTWRPARRVANGGVAAGRLIAVFSGPPSRPFVSGVDHIAIMRGYSSTGIDVWDSNWSLDYLFGRHPIKWSGGSRVSTANNYYTVTLAP